MTAFIPLFNVLYCDSDYLVPCAKPARALFADDPQDDDPRYIPQ